MSGTTKAVGVIDGVTTIEAGTPLTRLHYFDGKFLRADALTLEQDYHRELVRLSNLAGGWGVVHGLGIGLSVGRLTVSPGLAITPTGRIVLLGTAITADIAELIADAAAAPAQATGSGSFGECAPATTPPATPTPGQGIYEITVAPAQALCGNEEVFGKLCEDACITDTQRPYWREGMILRLRPVSLTLPTSSAVTLGLTHLRNRVASAYFAAEPWLTQPLLSAAGLGSGTWCNPAVLYVREEVPLGLLVREGSTTRVLDAWSARRERMDAQARGYWQGRMRMRPWNVFIAQILQFQCQLSGLFADGSPVFTPQPDDECAMLRQLLVDSIAQLEAARNSYAAGDAAIRAFLGDSADTRRAEVLGTLSEPIRRMSDLAQRLSDVQGTLTPVTPNRLLLNGGFVELPPAGYLPVIPGQSPVNLQLQKMFGEGVTLTLCSAPVDHLAHLLEEAQHMDRISLTKGLDNPAAKEPVEVFVPDGVILGTAESADGIQWFVKLDPTAIGDIFADGTDQPNAVAAINRAFIRESTGAAAGRIDAATGVSAVSQVSRILTGVARSTISGTDGWTIAMVLMPETETAGRTEAAYLSMQIDRDPFAAADGDALPVALEMRSARTVVRADSTTTDADVAVATGQFTVDTHFLAGPGQTSVRGRLDALVATTSIDSPDGERTQRILLDVTLTWQGNAASGTLGISFHLVNVTTTPVPWRVAWGGTPLHMTLSRENAAAVVKAAELVSTSPLPPESEPRLKALNAVGLIADATNDAGFVTRARRRLFGDMATPAGALQLRAVHDWVMFRRRRQVTCTAPAEPAKQPVTDAFQVLHVALRDDSEVKTLQAALAQRDPNALKGFLIKRVNVLHYTDSALMPEESVAQILDDWRVIQPARHLAVARVWENEPQTGQGWQNRIRLQRLVETLRDLIDPPGTGVIAALPRPPGALDEPGFDGGMVLATLAQQQAPDVTHRVFVVNPEAYAAILRALTGTLTAVVPPLTLDALQSVALQTVSVHFPAGGPTPLAADLDAVKAATAGIVFTNQPPLILVGTGGSAARGQADHAAIMAPLGAATTASVHAVTFADFGDGATEASVVAVGQIG